MSDTNNYSRLSVDELIAEEKKIKRMEIVSAVVVGFLIGIILYGVATNGFGFLYIFIPLFLIAGIVRYSQVQKKKLGEIRSAMHAKRSAG